MTVNSLQTPFAAGESEGSATQQALVEIRRMIIQGELKPGEKLKIDALRRRLDTGASPVREALSLLTSGQLVLRSDQRGFRAAPISRENFDEILQLRCTLEDKALRISIANRTEAWEESVVLSHHRMVRESEVEEIPYETRHKNFHLSLLSNCHSPILLEFCMQLYDLNIRYRLVVGRSLNYGNRSIGDEHLAIMQAAVAGNADLASERLLQHYCSTGTYLMKLLEDEQLLAS